MDTIAAIATAVGESGIGIIRLSGSQAIQTVDKIFRHVNKKSLCSLPSHRIYYGTIIDDTGSIIDEVLVSLMRAPLTYTREDVVEINCHGGIQSLHQILSLVLSGDNVRIAEPGEFTKRAFLNGRIDLVQAESVIDIIRSQTESAHRVSIGQLQGKLSAAVNFISNALLNIQAQIAVNIDYPEYDEFDGIRIDLLNNLQTVNDDINVILASSKSGRILREGLRTVIVGKPNVGKSSLLNLLLGEERAIVTDVPGTTRDTVEESLSLGGIPLHLIDTAGIREAIDPVEKIGVERSRKALEAADLVLLVLDASDKLDLEDLDLISKIPNERSIVILNKSDLKQQITGELINKEVPIITLSALHGEGKEALEEQVKRMFLSGQIDNNNDVIVSNIRHINLLKKAGKDIKQGIAALRNNIPIDIVNIDIENARHKLGLITGRSVDEDLINYIFAEFCVGK